MTLRQSSLGGFFSQIVRETKGTERWTRDRRRGRRFMCEQLETRLVPSTLFTRVADVDGFALDVNRDGFFEGVNTNWDIRTQALPISGTLADGTPLGNLRGLLEFNISSIGPDATVLSARVRGNVWLLQYSNCFVNCVGVNFHGYTGNGSLSTSDATAGSTNIVGSHVTDSIGPFSAAITTSFVQSVLSSPGSTGYVGLNSRMTRGDRFFFESTETAPGSFFPLAPTLEVVYNRPPAAVANAYSVDEDNTLTVAANGVLGNDTDPDADALTAIRVAGPSHGSLTLNADGSFDYTPDANFHGSDLFTYNANDGTTNSNIAAVTITVNAVNDAPVAAADSYAVDEDATLNVAAAGVLGNDSDLDGDSLSAVLVSGPANGSLTLNADGSFSYSPDVNFNGSDSFTYKANDGTANSNVATVTITVNAVNDAPVANAGPDETVDEPATITFDGNGSTDVDGDSLTYSWNFGDGATGTGVNPTHTYPDSGAYTVNLTVDDGHGGMNTDSMIVTVNNVAPTAGVAGPVSGVRGQLRTFSFTATDPSAVDQAATFTYAINWGDSTTQSISGSSSVQADHVFANSGSFVVSVQVTDKDGGVSQAAQTTIAINAAALQGNTLIVGGTPSQDTIVLKPANAGGISVTINNVNVGTFLPTDGIIVYAQAGNDSITLQKLKVGSQFTYITVPAIIFGDGGSDIVDAQGSSASNVILGGAGADQITGSIGRDILIGGADADTLRGVGEEDALIGGTTDHDANLTALAAMRSEWRRTDAGYQTRVDHLLGNTAGGLNGTLLLNPSTVHDDAAIDALFGGSGQDWFLYRAVGNERDTLGDAKRNEITTAI